MGCITSRGDNWPPKPYKRIVVRHSMLEHHHSDGTISRIETPVEDYVWVRPGCEIPNGCGGADVYNRGDDASPGQETAIRNLEDR